MSRATDELRAEHALVTVCLGALRAIGDHVRAGGPFPADDAVLALRFLREFLVATHFRKENEVVWPAIVMRSSGKAAAAIGDLIRTQDEASELISSLVVFWEPIGDLTEDERCGFANAIEALAYALRRMQETEEQLFRDCDSIVPPDDRIDWPEQFVAIETRRGMRATWEGQMHSLAATWH
jgi:hemerythrin-like domain-containing protein